SKLLPTPHGLGRATAWQFDILIISRKFGIPAPPYSRVITAWPHLACAGPGLSLNFATQTWQ
ncbi:hypothetical protein KI387_023608, partial [Taxus chinensis]